MGLLDTIRKRLARQSKPTDPSRHWNYYLPIANSAGVRVDPYVALTYAVVYRCVELIATLFGSMPKGVHRERPSGGADLVTDHLVHRLIARRPNPEMTAASFWETMIAHARVWGNGYAEIERAGGGLPANLWILNPRHVMPTRAVDKSLIYEVGSPDSAEVRPVLSGNMFHLKGLSFDGLQGYSTATMAARQIGLGIAQDQFASAFFGNGAWPGGFIEAPDGMEEEQRKNWIDEFNKRHGGSGKAFRIGVLPNGSKWHNALIEAEKSQIIEQRKFQIVEICRIFGVPPHKVFDLERATFSNIAEQNIEFVQYQLPWVKKIEQEIDLKLLGADGDSGLFSKVNVNALLRGDPKSRGEFYRLMHGVGAYSANRILELEDENPLGPDGDETFIPVNMMPLKNAVKMQPQNQDKPESEPKDGEVEAEGKLASFAADEFLRDVVGREIRKEAYTARNAGKRAKGDKVTYDVEVAAFAQRQAPEILSKLAKPVKVLCLLRGCAEPNGELVAAVDEHCRQLHGFLDLAFGSDDPEAYMIEAEAARIDRLMAAVKGVCGG